MQKTGDISNHPARYQAAVKENSSIASGQPLKDNSDLSENACRNIPSLFPDGMLFFMDKADI
jgi:hypothetical protein